MSKKIECSFEILVSVRNMSSKWPRLIEKEVGDRLILNVTVASVGLCSRRVHWLTDFCGEKAFQSEANCSLPQVDKDVHSWGAAPEVLPKIDKFEHLLEGTCIQGGSHGGRLNKFEHFRGGRMRDSIPPASVNRMTYRHTWLLISPVGSFVSAGGKNTTVDIRGPLLT